MFHDPLITAHIIVEERVKEARERSQRKRLLREARDGRRNNPRARQRTTFRESLIARIKGLAAGYQRRPRDSAAASVRQHPKPGNDEGMLSRLTPQKR